MTISLHLRPFLAGAVAFGAFMTASAGLAQAQSEPAVTISVTGITTHDGYIMVALYDEAGWGGEPVDAVREAVGGDAVIVTLAAPAPGQYGIRLFHDIDGDGKLNANIVGLPTEPFGFSNNAPPRFGPPSFAAAAFDVGDDGAAQTISLQ